MHVPRFAATGEGLDFRLVPCAEYGREADERWTVAERWTWWSDGLGELLPFCPDCAECEFGHRVVGRSQRPSQASWPTATFQRTPTGLPTTR